MFGRKKDKREEFYNKKSRLSSRLQETIEHGDYKNDKIRAGRIASMKVEFVEDQ